jgi:hypothetical protein
VFAVLPPATKNGYIGLPCLDRLTQKFTNNRAHNIEDIDTNGEIRETIVGIVLSMTLYNAVHWLQCLYCVRLNTARLRITYVRYRREPPVPAKYEVLFNYCLGLQKT